VIDEGDDCAVNVLELESLRLVGIDVGNIDAEVAGNAGVGEERAGVLKERRELPRLGLSRKGRNEHAGGDCEPGECKFK